MGLSDDFMRKQRRREPTRAAVETTREQKLRAVTAVLRSIPDPADQREVLNALFAEGRKQLHHGDKPSQEWAAARREWLDRCRAWCAEQGRPRSTSWIPAEEQRAYTDATGDVWTPPARRAA